MYQSRATWSYSLALGVLFFVLCFLAPFVSHAQFLPGEQGVVLTQTPEYPEPFSTVTIGVEDYTIDTLGMIIDWYVAGTLRSDLQNERSISVELGELGTSLPIRVVFSKDGRVVRESSSVVTPRSLHLIIEADTYVPDFYQGRALPSPESKVRALAIIDDGTGSPLSSFTYTWSLDDEVLLGGPVRGKYAVPITASRFKNQTLRVQVSNTDGIIVGERFMYIEKTDPRILFYEYSPLRGLLERSVVSPLPLISEEMTIYGEPFFFHVPPDTARADFSFTIDGTPVNTLPNTAPNAITVRQVGEGGSAVINLRGVSKERIPQVVTGEFELFFE